ncbi:hypothetical protein FQN54_005625 [Arachnomyces sp. PD_36]|nr:hypothetical protein FQN54_005625 [Arachnomyces sp. PD_36]
MAGKCLSSSKLCTVHLQAYRSRLLFSIATGSSPGRSSFSTTPSLRDSKKDGNDADQKDDTSQAKAEEEGAMTRRLTDMMEQAQDEGGSSAQKNIEAAEFSEELKQKLEERIAASAFKSQNAAAFSLKDMPSSAGQGTQDIAAASPWSGTESLHDSALRMLDDASKPIRVPYKIPKPPPIIRTPVAEPKKSTGERLASARDRTSTYALSQDSSMSDKERESLRKELRDRFTPGARPMPATLQGLNSLANEKIEQAMVRGKFNGISRGKGKFVERDSNADNPYLNTTEYFMNRLIQKQEIVPPWIEKQQELSREKERFRSQLRVAWRRHAARSIASKGGSLRSQMRRAEAHAAAEERLSGNGSSTTHPSKSSTEQESQNDSSTSTNDHPSSQPSTSDPELILPPFRDPAYLSTESSYHNHAIKNLNSLARTYNLMAPRSAQMPYLNLNRELASCFADVAPTVAAEIHRRATERATPKPLERKTASNTGFISTLGTKQSVRVYDEDLDKGYGFKQFWKDVFGRKSDGKEAG